MLLLPTLRSISKALLLAAFAASAPTVVACSGGEEEAATGGGSGGTSNVVIGGGTENTGNNGSGGGNTVSMNGNTCVIEDDGTDCVGVAYEGENLRLDIYIMFDKSGSMCSCVDPVFNTPNQPCPNSECNQTRMDAIREATRLFMEDPESAGVGVGLGYFGKQPFNQASCDPADHELADVEVGVLPDHAGAIMASLDEAAPTGETPTGAAIRGACNYAQAHKESNPANQVVILLLTDGIPEAPRSCCDPETATTPCMPVDPPCCPTIDDAAAAATECLDGDPGIKTYVLGVGPALTNLSQIAEAGGTSDAYLVEGGNVADEVLGALRSIRGDAIPCSMEIPPPPDGQDLVLGQTNITYASASCEPTYFYNVETAEFCGDEGGWYYNDPNAPETIELCPTSCDQVSVPGGKLLFTVGCETRYVPK